jgi:hypothetical protein
MLLLPNKSRVNHDIIELFRSLPHRAHLDQLRSIHGRRSDREESVPEL